MSQKTIEECIEELRLATVSFGMSMQDAAEYLVKLMQEIYNDCGSNAEILEKKEDILYRFKNGEYIKKEEDWSWLDKDDTNE